MKDSRNSFESEWKTRFEGIEIIPDKKVWTGVNASLANSQVRIVKRKVSFYKFVAAAAIVFAIGVSLYSYYLVRVETEKSKTLVSEKIPILNESEFTTGSESPVDIESIDMGIKITNREENDETGNMIINSIVDPDQSDKETIRNKNGKEKALNVLNAENDFLPNHLITVNFLSTNEFNPPTKRIRSAGYPGYINTNTLDGWDEVIKEEGVVNHDNKLWAGVNFSSGKFDPNISYGQRPSAAYAESSMDASSVVHEDIVYANAFDTGGSLRAQTPEESSYNPEVSYSYGLNVGYNIAKRFVVMGGMSYLYNNSSTTVNSYIEQPSTNQKYPNQAIMIERASPQLETVNQSSSEIVLNSAYEFVSIPVNFGYYLVKKKLQWLMTAGLTTDFLLKNTISDTNNNLETIEFSGSGETPYNPAYLNGTVGSQINYTLGEHYRFSLEPSYRYGLSYLTKEEASFNSRPSSFNFSAGIAYIIK